MIYNFRTLFTVRSLRRKIACSLLGVLIYRTLAHIPVLPIDTSALIRVLSSSDWITLLYALSSAGVIDNFSFVSLGVVSFFLAVPIVDTTRTANEIKIVDKRIESLKRGTTPNSISIEQLEKEKDKLQKKRRILLYITASAIAFPISWLTYRFFWHFAVDMRSISLLRGVFPKFYIISALILGSLVCAWLIETLSRRGLGRGLTWIVLSNICHYLITKFTHLPWNILDLLVYIAVCLSIVYFMTLLSTATRKIPVQYAKRVVGRKMYGGQSTHIPLPLFRPDMFQSFTLAFLALSTFIAIPFYIFDLGERFTWYNFIVVNLLSLKTTISYLIFILFYFISYIIYTAIVFNPIDLADNMRRFGGFIPGIRPGRRTSEYIDRVQTTTVFGSLFFFGMFFGGVVLLLSSALQTRGYFNPIILIFLMTYLSLSVLNILQTLEMDLLMRHYELFIKKGR